MLADARESTASAVLPRLLDLCDVKNDETQFAIGEALAFAWGGVNVDADRVLTTSFTSLSAAAKSTTAFDHADPTMPNYKLTPDITTSKLVLSRPHLRAASTKPVIASPPAVSMTPQGYPVYEGITVCR